MLGWSNWQDLPNWVRATALAATVSEQLTLLSVTDDVNDAGRPVESGLYQLGDEVLFFMVEGQTETNPALVYFMKGQIVAGTIVWSKAWPFW